jgi:uncharacterized protein (TIGR02145 family)
MVLLSVLSLRCGIFEPFNRKGSLAIILVQENHEQGLGKALETLSSVRYVLKKGSVTVNEDYLPKSGSYFEGTIGDLDPGDDYSVQIYGMDSSGDILGMGSKSSISITSGKTTTETISWIKFKPILNNPSNGSTGISTNPTLSWNSVGGASSYGLQVSTNSNFTGGLVFDQSGITGTNRQVSGLSEGTTYYWRVNATGPGGTSGWSDDRYFTTSVSPPVPPTLSSPSDGSIGVSTSPTLSWNSVNGASSYGLQVSTNSSFSSLVVSPSGITSTSYVLSGLSEGGTYYWRVNATGPGGTSGWSDDRYFTTGSTHETGTMTGNDGKIYQTVKIGNQWWMAENLKETEYRNGNAIQNVTDNSIWAGLSTGARCAYDNSESNASVYGYLYNWYAVSDSRNIAPPGWHVPTDEEWKTLEKHLGMSQSEADNSGERGTNEGGKLKETGTIHWFSPNEGATNESGFSALPGGYRYDYDGIFYYLGYSATFWSSTELGANYAWYRYLYFSSSLVSRYINDKQDGFSIRLLRD